MDRELQNTWNQARNICFHILYVSHLYLALEVVQIYPSAYSNKHQL